MKKMNQLTSNIVLSKTNLCLSLVNILQHNIAVKIKTQNVIKRNKVQRHKIMNADKLNKQMP